MTMEKTVEYSIKKVTVFLDRARIMCTGKVQVSSDVTHLIIDGLPLNLEPDSLRVAGKGSAKVRILGVDISSHYYEQTPSQHARELENQLDELHDEVQLLDDQNKMWDAQLEHLQGLRLATSEYARGLSRGRSTVEDQLQLIQFFRKQDEELRSEQRKIQPKHRELERRILRIEKELDELRSVRPQHRFQAKVAVEVVDEGDFWPEVDYVVRKASWQPLYDLRFVEYENGTELEISLIAQITQRTGQEWQGVQLSVSTARPALNQRIPDLKPWYIDEARPQMPRSVKTRGAAVEPAMAKMSTPQPESHGLEPQDEEIFQASVASASIHDNGTVLSFDVPGKWDILSDGSPHKMVLNKLALEPIINYLAIPKHTDAVYRRATLINSSDSPFLGGKANIFVAGEYIGKTRIEHTPVGGELELLLGVEEKLVIKRELAKRLVDKRLLRENRILRYAYKIDLRNLLQSNVNVEIQDQIPISKHEQIKVKLDRANPKQDKKSELNLMEWHIDIESGAQVEIGYEYTIEHPATLTVSGLFD